MPPVTETERFAGCLVGQALGDALGFMVEGYPPERCAHYVESAVRPRQLTGYTRGPFRFGQYSDDTQLARELARSMVERGGFDPEDYARRVATLFAEHRIVGRGRATEQAANRLADGVPWEEAGTPPPAAGNGSAMRAAPVGLLLAHDFTALVRVAHDQGRITHQDSRCSAGAVAIAGATAIALRSSSIDVPALCATLSEWTAPFDSILAQALRELPRWIEEPPDAAVKKIKPVGLNPNHADGWSGISPFVTGSVLWSLYAFLRSPDDYWEAICTAIAVGGDVDTTAAMTGAIAGTHVGLRGIPEEEARRITDQGAWGYDEMVELGADLHALHMQLEGRTT